LQIDILTESVYAIMEDLFCHCTLAPHWAWLNIAIFGSLYTLRTVWSKGNHPNAWFIGEQKFCWVNQISFFSEKICQWSSTKPTLLLKTAKTICGSDLVQS